LTDNELLNDAADEVKAHFSNAQYVGSEVVLEYLITSGVIGSLAENLTIEKLLDGPCLQDAQNRDSVLFEICGDEMCGGLQASAETHAAELGRDLQGWFILGVIIVKIYLICSFGCCFCL
ncbi:MAG: hypothetical protein QGI45_04590, partial [Myxococcota bacterium]|nr:hypothetical protein [Myxococcota bacterium]